MWEYKIVVFHAETHEEESAMLDQYGRSGWELIQAPQGGYTSRFYFKRRRGMQQDNP